MSVIGHEKSGKAHLGGVIPASLLVLLLVGLAGPPSASAQQPLMRQAPVLTPVESGKPVSQGVAQPLPVTNAPVRRGIVPKGALNRGDSRTLPAIAAFSPSTCISPGAVLTVRGAKFGSGGSAGFELAVVPKAQGPRARGTQIRSFLSWSDTSVAFKFPSAAGLEPGAPVSVVFRDQGQDLTAKSIQICQSDAKGKSLPTLQMTRTETPRVGATLTPANAALVSPVDKPVVEPVKSPRAAITPLTVKTVKLEPKAAVVPVTMAKKPRRMPNVQARRTVSQGGVYRVRVQPQLVSNIGTKISKISLEVVRNFVLPEGRTPEPSQEPPGFAPFAGDVDPQQDAGPKASDCPEGDPNCPDIPEPVNGAIDPAEWQVKFGPACPPGAPGCEFVTVTIWPDGDPMPEGNPKMVDCTTANALKNPFCEMLIAERPDPLGNPLGDPTVAEDDAASPPPCAHGDSGNNDACQTCTGNDTGSNCVSHEVDDQGNDNWVVEWTVGYEDGDGKYGAGTAEMDAEAVSGRNCTKTSVESGNGTYAITYTCN